MFWWDWWELEQFRTMKRRVYCFMYYAWPKSNINSEIICYIVYSCHMIKVLYNN